MTRVCAPTNLSVPLYTRIKLQNTRLLKYACPPYNKHSMWNLQKEKRPTIYLLRLLHNQIIIYEDIGGPCYWQATQHDTDSVQFNETCHLLLLNYTILSSTSEESQRTYIEKGRSDNNSSVSNVNTTFYKTQ